MLELPEAVVLARQINHTLMGKQIACATANHTRHKFAWYNGDPGDYNNRLAGKTVNNAEPFGGHVKIIAGDQWLLLSAALRYHPAGDKRPAKHQLLLEFDDGDALSATVQMWAVLGCFAEGKDSGWPDFIKASQRPSPLTEAFDRVYFDSLFDALAWKMSAKGFLATNQRIPGLGNGVLQDILWTAKIHPKRKMDELGHDEIERMFQAVKHVLHQMTECGGRDTERDLFGEFGRYHTVLSKNTVNLPCPGCGGGIQKEAYMGGSIYYCATCQPL